ncbi:hypothetical protein AB0G74_01490 [Streptomyces sp. NPDC020875]|uniref:hypothetical protein n=1 Tax=Streptomyces sp. NPDC020875 TaxID=3154898 RepID=UPI0033D0CDF0
MADVDPTGPDRSAGAPASGGFVPRSASETPENHENPDETGTGTEPGAASGETTDPSTAVPEADAAEQHTDVRPLDDERPRIDLDRANEADAVEQSRVVALDEDDYR